MSEPHPMLSWAKGRKSIDEIAAEADCSEWHLRNIFAGRKQASLRLAKRLSDISDGAVPMDAFLRADDAEVRT